MNVVDNNLPLQLSSFVGREQVAAEVRQLLASSRLLTLTGAGGCGKTRLAMHIAENLLRESSAGELPPELRFVDGIWLVELAPLADPDVVPQHIGGVLGVHA